MSTSPLRAVPSRGLSSSEAEPPLFRLQLRRLTAVPLAGAAAAEAAALLGAPPSARHPLASLVVEVVQAIVEESFEGGAQGIEIDLAVEPRSSGLSIQITDTGLPSHFTSAGMPPRIGSLLALGYAESVRFWQDGAAGNRAEIRLAIPRRRRGGDSRVVSPEGVGAAHQPVSLEQLAFRAMTPEDGVEVARLYYRTYGYTKTGTRYIYEPETMAGMLRAGQHLALVAVAPDGRVVAHLGVQRDHVGDPVCSAGILAVDPDYRQAGIARAGAVRFGELLAGAGIRAAFAECSTVHTASQRVTLGLGGRVVGLVLSRQNPEVSYEAMEDDAQGLRRATLVFFQPLAAVPPAVVHAPPAYAPALERIYADARLPRALAPAPDAPTAPLPARSRFHVDLAPNARLARIFLDEYGADFRADLERQLGMFGRDGYRLIELLLPLDNPLSATLGADLHPLGLFFCGVLPDLDGGDRLLLASCLLEQAPETIHLHGETAQWLLDTVLADYWDAQEAHDEHRQRQRRQLPSRPQ